MPKLGTLIVFIEKQWNSVSRPQVLYHPSGWYVFWFDTREDMEAVLKWGPWLMANRSLVPKPWTSGFKLIKGLCVKCPFGFHSQILIYLFGQSMDSVKLLVPLDNLYLLIDALPSKSELHALECCLRLTYLPFFLKQYVSEIHLAILQNK